MAPKPNPCIQSDILSLIIEINAGRLDLLCGARKLAQACLKNYMVENDPDFVAFLKFHAETEHLPLAKNWKEATLPAGLKDEIRGYEQFYSFELQHACKVLFEKYSK